MNEVQKIRARSGLTQAEFAKKIGVSTSAVISWETGTREPKPGSLEAIHQAFPEQEHSDVVFIPRYSVEASAGGGIEVDREDVEQWLALRSDYLARNGIVAENCLAIRISGDSMAPEVKDGDVAFIDRSRKEVTAKGGLYVFKYLGAILCKHLHRTPTAIIVKSVNQNYPQFAINIETIADTDYAVVGRVFNTTRSYV